MVKERNEVLPVDCWNVAALYPNFQAWEQDFQKVYKSDAQPHWPILTTFKGVLRKSATDIRNALEHILTIERKLSALYTYAHLRHDEDVANDQHKQNFIRISAALNDFSQEIAWVEPELLAIPDSSMSGFLADPVLSEYRFYLERILRIKPHILSSEQEGLMALAGKALQAPSKAFSAINDADFKFGYVQDGQGKERELTHALYGLYIRDHDRTLRQNSFLHYHSTFLKYENTLCELVHGQVQSHLFNAKARNYRTCLEAALFPKNIDTDVYHSLISAIHDGIGALHKYVKLRQRLPGIDKLHLYDMYVPMNAKIEMNIPYSQAEDMVVDSVAPLGSDYQNCLKAGLKDQRWVDRYENKNKRSGAYSSGCFDSMPYILMNYKGTLRDAFTLAHEAGHSMHSHMSRTHQPYQYSDYPIFLAEVASTFNESLLNHLLMKSLTKEEEQIYLLTEQIEDIRGTLFRQTMFAEFELLIHDMAERNVPLTPSVLKEEYRKLNAYYFGPLVDIDKEAEIEWARIPHFYYNFYVFQYATGISAALALSERVLKGGASERNDYLSFIKGGNSRYPLDMLKLAGIDMRSPQPVHAAIEKFSGLVDRLDLLLSAKNSENAKEKNGSNKKS